MCQPGCQSRKQLLGMGWYLGVSRVRALHVQDQRPTHVRHYHLQHGAEQATRKDVPNCASPCEGNVMCTARHVVLTLCAFCMHGVDSRCCWAATTCLLKRQHVHMTWQSWRCLATQARIASIFQQPAMQPVSALSVQVSAQALCKGLGPAVVWCPSTVLGATAHA